MSFPVIPDIHGALYYVIAHWALETIPLLPPAMMGAVTASIADRRSPRPRGILVTMASGLFIGWAFVELGRVAGFADADPGLRLLSGSGGLFGERFRMWLVKRDRFVRLFASVLARQLPERPELERERHESGDVEI